MPDSATVERAIAVMQRSPQNRVYFFEKLNDPAWIKPLRDAGFFRQPPEMQGTTDGLIVPPWPESQYLARMAEQAPDLVADVLRDVPDTENFRVRWDILRAARSFNQADAAHVAEREIKWIEGHSSLGPGYPGAAAALALHLAQLGAATPGLALVTAVLELLPVDEEGPHYRSFATRVDQWTYEQLVRQFVPALTEFAGSEVIEMVGDLLERGLEQDPVSKKPHDNSEIWRPAIENHSQNFGFDVRDGIVSALRDAAAAWVGQDPGRVKAMSSMLQSRKWTLFRRIALQLLNEKADVAPELAIEAAVNPTDFFESGVYHEFMDLSARVFGRMSDRQKDRWVAMLNEGPTWPSRDPAEREAEGMDQQWYERIVRGWRRSRLQLLEADLRPSERTELDELLAELGRDEHPGFLNWHESWTGPTSPLDAGQLEGMTPADIVAYVRNWVPDQSFKAASPEGLSRLLTKRVAASPAEFGEIALGGRLKGLDPTYVRAVLEGWEQALREDTAGTFEWDAALNTIETVVKGPEFTRPSVEDDYHARDWDPDWSYARKAAARLILRALEANAIDVTSADRTWNSLAFLSWDPEPTPSYEKQYGGANMDPLTLSLNTIRGQAMHAVIAYAAWLKRNNAASATTDMTQVAENLEQHLQPGRDPSETTRGVFGARMAQLVWIDPQWVEDHLDTLFPRDAPSLRLATFDTFLAWGHPSGHLFRVLAGEYSRAVDELPTPEERRSRAGRLPGHALAEHLGIYLWHGRLEPAPDSMLGRFVERAGSDELANLVSFLGRTMDSLDEEQIAGQLEPGVRERLMETWNLVRDHASTRTPEQRNEVLSPFGWWYGAGFL